MTAVTERIPLDEIAVRAAAVPFWRSVLRALTFVPFAVGWLAAKAFAVVWLVLAWVWVALCEGWESAHGPSRKQRIEAQAAEIRELRTQLSRFSG